MTSTTTTTYSGWKLVKTANSSKNFAKQCNSNAINKTAFSSTLCWCHLLCTNHFALQDFAAVPHSNKTARHTHKYIDVNFQHFSTCDICGLWLKFFGSIADGWRRMRRWQRRTPSFRWWTRSVNWAFPDANQWSFGSTEHRMSQSTHVFNDWSVILKISHWSKTDIAPMQI